MATGSRRRLLMLSATVMIAGAVLLFFRKASAEPLGPPRRGIPEPHSVNGGGDAIENIRALHDAGIPLRILPLGDSITQADNRHYSYRYYLWILLTDAGFNFDFVGSMNHNFSGNPTWPTHAGRSFDSDHEGHWGWSADQILYGFPQKRDERLSEWLKGYTPDIVLLHLGTNDVLQFESAFSTTTELRQIIETLRDDNPMVIVLLAKLIPVLKAGMDPHIDDLNARFDALAAEISTPASPVIIVDQYDGLNGETDMCDPLHPSSSGELKMAARWFEALQDIIGR